MHIRGLTNPADIGTKRATKAKESKDRLRNILHDGYYVPDTSAMTEEENAALDIVHQILGLRNFRFI